MRDPPGDLQRVGDVVVDGPVREQLEVLEDDPDVAPVVRNAPARDLGQVTTGHANRALARLDLLDQQSHDRRLARTGRADEEHEVAAIDPEGRLIEADVAARIGHVDAAELDHAGALAGRVEGRLRSAAGVGLVRMTAALVECSATAFL